VIFVEINRNYVVIWISQEMSSKKNSELIWVLGAKNDNADKSILWNEEFPNFADPDILIINLSSLDRKMRDKIDKSSFHIA
jgi:hypothetical protein